MASGRFATSLALKCLASLLPPTAEGGCAQLHYLVACGDARSARGRSGAQATERVRFRRRRRRARGVPSRHVPDTVRARLTIQVNRPLLHPNTRRFNIRPNRRWYPSRHPPKFFLRKEKTLQLSLVQVVVAYTPFQGCLTPGWRQDKHHTDVPARERPLKRGVRHRDRVKNPERAIVASPQAEMY